MLELYENSDILKRLREKKIPDDCIDCENSETCRGGLKCLSYAICGNWDVKDLGCDKL